MQRSARNRRNPCCFHEQHLDSRTLGEMAERLNAPVLKTGVPVRVPRVRIPLSPLYQTQSGSRNRPQTPEFDEGCGCRRLGAVPRVFEQSAHQSSSMIGNGCRKNRQPLVQPNRSHFRSIRRSMCPSSLSLKAATGTSAERRHQGRRDWRRRSADVPVAAFSEGELGHIA